MKIRSGFVSNSSSASFVLDKRYLTAGQIEKIITWLEKGGECESWDITDTDDFIKGWTVMDNDYFSDYLKELEMPMKTIVSYKMLKDSGKFTFDIESFQRATIVTDIDGEGNIQELISKEAEQSIDGLIDNLVELFQ